MKNIIITILAILVLLLGGYLVYDKIVIKEESASGNEEIKDEIKEENVDTSKEEVVANCGCEVETIKNFNDVFLDTDSNAQKAQKIANEVVTAVNNKDWYYLAKMVGRDADDFIKYGIYNYNIDVSNYSDREGTTYVFVAQYDWDKTKLNSLEDVALGRLLVIKFESGGRITIDPNCTGA